MSTFAKLPGRLRTGLGTTASRRLRVSGAIPATVYGHKQAPGSLAVDGDALTGLIRAGNRLVDLEVEGKVEQALLKDVQWDTFGVSVLHVDFLRVDRDEKVKIEVPIALRGTAPGALAGGVLEIPHHTVLVECLAVEIPENIQVRIGHLGVGDAIHVSDLVDVPPTVKILSPPEMVLVQIEQPKAAPEPTEVAGEAGAQPALVTPAGKEKDEAGKS